MPIGLAVNAKNLLTGQNKDIYQEKVKLFDILTANNILKAVQLAKNQVNSVNTAQMCNVLDTEKSVSSLKSV